MRCEIAQLSPCTATKETTWPLCAVAKVALQVRFCDLVVVSQMTNVNNDKSNCIFSIL